MPIVEISAQAAFARLRSDPASARWPGEGPSGERLEGAVEVACRPSFQITPGDLIFTAGSCFARNIEFRLADVGLETPMYGPEVERRLEGLDAQPHFFNKYNVAVIRQELAWAAGEDQGTKGQELIALPDGALFDALLNPRKGAAPPHVARSLRHYAEQLYRRFPQCRVVVITLGVAELWRDRRSGLPLNKAPPAALAEAEPDRFVLEVMDYREVLNELEAIHDLLSRHGHPDFRMLVTVSPVPLSATFRPIDVIAANAYSKAVQRAAVEAFAAGHPNVDYLPSYETVVQSDRRLAFDSDNRHVQGPMVDRVVDRFLSAYAPGLKFAPSRRALIRSGRSTDAFDSLLAAADERMRVGDHTVAADLLGRAIAQFGDRHAVIGVTELRLRYGSCLVKTGQRPEAVQQLRLALDANDDHRPAILRKCAERMLQCGDLAGASEALELAVARGAAPGELASCRSRLAAAMGGGNGGRGRD